MFHALIRNHERLLICSMESNIYFDVFEVSYFDGDKRRKLLHFESGPTSLYAIVNRLNAHFVPHGLIALLAGTFTVLPWLRWSTRFSLRTLLIVTTLVAMALGFAIWMVR